MLLIPSGINVQVPLTYTHVSEARRKQGCFEEIK